MRRLREEVVVKTYVLAVVALTLGLGAMLLWIGLAMLKAAT